MERIQTLHSSCVCISVENTDQNRTIANVIGYAMAGNPILIRMKMDEDTKYWNVNNRKQKLNSKSNERQV